MPFVPDASRTPGRSVCFLPLLFAVLVSQSALASDEASPQASELSVVDEQLSISGMATASSSAAPWTGVQIAFTTYDTQHRASQGHMVGRDPGANDTHFSFTFWGIIPTDIEGSDRFVNYISWNHTTGETNQPFPGQSISLGNFARAGYVRGDVASGNQWHAALHQNIELNYPTSVWHYRFPHPPVALVQLWNLGNSMGPDGERNDQGIWPDCAITQEAEGSDIWHQISTGGEVFHLPIADGYITYWRLDQSLGTIWEGPVLIDSSVNLGYVIDASDNSDEVAIAYTYDFLDAVNNPSELNQVVYRESSDLGLSWINGAGQGDEDRIWVTSYNDPNAAEEREAWIEVSTAYDHSGDLHIAWIELKDDSEQRAIKHWSDARGTIQPAVYGYYPNAASWKGTLAFLSLGIGDGATLCKGGVESNLDYVYVSYAKFGGETPLEQSDVSHLGFSGCDIYLTGSSNGGRTWSPSGNLTNSYVPDCGNTAFEPGTPGFNDCRTESWGSMARDVGDIEIMYIGDIQSEDFNASGWYVNSVQYINLPGGTLDAPFVCPLCVCSCHGDPQCDGVIADVLDVVWGVDIAFRGVAAVIDPGCPMERTDVNCDGVTDVIDVVKIVRVAFRSADPAVEFCAPCGL